MHSWFVLVLFGTLLVQIIGRPQQTEYNNDSDLEEPEEEEENEPASDEFLTDEDETRLTEQLTDSKTSRHRDTRDESQELNNEQPRPYQRRHASNKYLDPSYEQPEMSAQQFSNRDITKLNRNLQSQEANLINKRTVELEGKGSNEEGELLFEKDRPSKVDKSDTNEGSDSNDQSRYYKQYYNTMQAENRDTLDNKGHDNARFNLRDRREAKDLNQAETQNMSSNQGNKDKEKTDNEDEESAIKRHIKKLSGDQLDQLLSSLTEEKRDLLKKIIDGVDSNENGYINKREITKKAGAVEENGYIENCQSDLSKVQGGSSAIDFNTEATASSNTESTESSKSPEIQTESSDGASSMASMTSMSNVELTGHDEMGEKKTESHLNSFPLNTDPKNQGEMVANVQLTPKTENKRETNLEDLEAMSLDDPKIADNDLNVQSGQDYSNDQGYYSPQDDNMSQLLDDDEPHFREEVKNYKREAYPDKQDMADSIKSLEESFPNSNAYDDSIAYSGPLVRVKRKYTAKNIKKRSAALLPDTKVAYFPYKAENEDEDNDEGNEFDDEGFYDRTSNLANNDNKGVEEDIANAENVVQDKDQNVDNSKSLHENLESDTSLGSDTDSVLVGGEGVDDNLMFSSNARNRRTAEDNSSGIADVKSERTPTLLEDEIKAASQNYFNAPHYQENDAFGPLPRSYDGDLSRYKRIRRVKQSHNAQDVASLEG